MKPISVKFQCFGPYLEKQEIDFTQLGDQGLFLICGETGSGKTTILEAMSYALYGKSTGDPTGNENDDNKQAEKKKQTGKTAGSYRGELWTMRHENAPDHMDTIVEYTFSIGEERYQFHRSLKTIKSKSADKKKNGDKYNENCKCRRFENGEWVPFPDVKDTKTDVNRKARELIGLNHVQFCQVIILPQGKFETLLTSTSADKERLLVQIFRTGRWQKATDLLEIQVKKQEEIVKAQKTEISGKLMTYGCKQPEELRQKLETQENMASQAKEKEKTAESLLNKKNKEVDHATKLDEKFRNRDAVGEKLQSLEERKEDIQKEKETLSLALKAERLRDHYSNYRQKKEERETVRKALERAQNAYEKEEANQRTTKQKREQHDEKLETIQEKKETLKNYDNRVTVYQSLADKKSKVEECKCDLQQEENEAQTAKAKLDRESENLKLAQTAYDQLFTENKRLWNLYIGGIAYELAQKLEDGKKCPVCGSIHHPEPAEPLEEQITKEFLDRHDRTLEEGYEKVKKCKENLEAARNENKEKEIKCTQAENNLNTASEEYKRAQEQCIDGISDLAALKRGIKQLETELKAYEDEETDLNREEGRIEQALLTAAENLDTARAAEKEAEEGWLEIRAFWENSRLQAGFDTDADYDNACMDPEEKEEKQQKVIAFEQELKTVIEDYDNRCRELEALEKPNVDAIKEDRDLTQKEYANRKSEFDNCKKISEEMKRDLLDIEKKYAVYEQDSKKADSLRAFVDGLIGSRGVSLQRYVLGVMLDAITDEANQILQTVYDGRYRLYRTDESSGRSHKRGLELGVYSNGNAEGRPASSLSGGEKFLVSLCLAIGLSVVVQAQGCGDRMEALFVDEGFGSLDQNRIGDALMILNYIKGSSGLVGVISHVEALAESIQAKLKIRKTENGSKCEFQF